MKKINWECLAQMAVLFVIDGLLLAMLVTDRLKYYVHPRLEKYVWFAVAGLFFVALSFLPLLFKPRHKLNLLPCVILLIPIMSGFTLQYSAPTGTAGIQAAAVGSGPDSRAIVQDTPVAENSTQQADGTGPGENQNTPSDSASQNNVILEEDFNAEGDFITISDEDYGKWYMDAYINPQKYNGKTVKLKGTVFRMEGFDKNEFVPARMYMACCAADLSPIGFICKSSQAEKLKDNEWVYVTAKIKVEYEKHMDETTLVLYADTVAPAEKPREELVYLY